MDINKEQRNLIIEILNKQYIIPEEYCNCVKEAIKKYSNSNLKDTTIDKYINTPLSFKECITTLSNSKGKLAEWLVCLEYNALKNNSNVILTIVNPDPTSKCDLLHIISTKNGFKAVPGPDVKCYETNIDKLLKEYEKNCLNKSNIAFIDVGGFLTSPEKIATLTESQKAKYDTICKKHPKKTVLPSEWDNLKVMRVLGDYFKYIYDGSKPFDRCIKIDNEFLNIVKSKKDSICLPEDLWGGFKNNSKQFLELSLTHSNNFLRTEQIALDKSIKQKKIQKSKPQNTLKVKKINKLINLIQDNIGNILMFSILGGLCAAECISIKNEIKEQQNKELSFEFDNLQPHLISINNNLVEENDNAGKFISKEYGKEKVNNDSIMKNNHKSPEEHEVRGHFQHYNIGGKLVLKEKKPYSRGKNKK